MQPSDLPTPSCGLPGKEASVCVPLFSVPGDPRPLLQRAQPEQVACLDPLQGTASWKTLRPGPLSPAAWHPPGLSGSQALGSRGEAAVWGLQGEALGEGRRH